MNREVHFQNDFDAAEFSRRCQHVMDSIGDAVAVLQGSPATGAFDLFRQHNDFYYLCGVEVPHAYLLIDAKARKTTLYLPPRDEKHERSEGAILSSDDVELGRQLTGVDNVCVHDALADDIADAKVIFLLGSEPEGRQTCQDVLLHARSSINQDPWDQSPTPGDRFQAKLSVAAPQATFRDLSPLLHEMRLIKSPSEIELMRRAGKLTGLAVAEAMKCTKAGLFEFHLGAQADLIYLANGAKGAGYRPIIACGENIFNAHYFRNDCPLVDGKLVLMDYAPDVGNYTSDIGRMWPVNGRYSDVQRELYGFVVQYHKILLRLIRPGLTADQIYRAAETEATPIVESTNWSKPIYRKAAQDVLTYDRHLTHPVGMAVHDVGEYRDRPMQSGVVLALDPQMWVPDEQLYIRVEDTVVITETGVENLTDAAPLELDDVEQIMNEPGVYELRPQLLVS